MERMNLNDIDTRSAALGGLAGLGLGGLVGWLAASRLSHRRLQAELVSIKDHYDSRLVRLQAQVTRHERAERLRRTEEEAIERRTQELIASQGYSPSSEDSDGWPGNPVVADPDNPDGYGSGLPAVGQPGPEDLDGPDDDGDGGPGAEAPEVPKVSGPSGADLHPGSVTQPDKSKPYEITFEAMDEFRDEGWDSMTITYYIGDGVLVDDKDQPIRNILMTTGPLSRESFGVMSGDDRILYIRNHKLEHDFEVVLHDGKWTEMVGLSDNRGNQAE